MRQVFARICIFIGFANLAVGLSFVVYHLGNRIVRAMPTDNSDPVHISLLPSQPTMLPGSSNVIEVFLHPNGRQVSAIELHLAIDPNILEFTSSHPIDPEAALSWVLPNCQSGLPNNPDGSCVATSSATSSQALIYLGVPCAPSGCTLPSTTASFPIAKLFVRAKNTLPNATAINSVASGSATLIAAFNSDSDVTGFASPTNLTVTDCALTHDFIPNRAIDVVDIMQVAARWNTQPSTPDYNGQYDLDQNHLINVVDIQQVASEWSQTCLP